MSARYDVGYAAWPDGAGPCHADGCPNAGVLALGCCAIPGSTHVATVEVCDDCMTRVRGRDRVMMRCEAQEP